MAEAMQGARLKASESIHLVWQIAAQEAAAADFKYIEPDHFYLAVLKFSELPADIIAQFASTSTVVEELCAEVSVIRLEFERCGITSTPVRRKMRSLLGRGVSPYHGGQMHRSQQSRDLFTVAASISARESNRAITVKHLLRAISSSPTPVMTEVLGSSAKDIARGEAPTPLLDKYGKDLTVQTAKSSPNKMSNRDAESRALVQVLSSEARKIVLLISESESSLDEVIGVIAHEIVSGNVPSMLKNMRLIDIRMRNRNSFSDAAEDLVVPVSLHDKLLAEAISACNVILVAPAVMFWGDPKGEHIRYRHLVESRLLRCILVSWKSALQNIVRPDRELRRYIHTMWIERGTNRSIPEKL